VDDPVTPGVACAGRVVGELCAASVAAQQAATARKAIALISDESIRAGSRSLASSGTWDPDACQHRLQVRTVMAVRPDGYVGFCSHLASASKLVDYLQHHFGLDSQICSSLRSAVCQGHQMQGMKRNLTRSTEAGEPSRRALTARARRKPPGFNPCGQAGFSLALALASSLPSLVSCRCTNE
jgi:hypothetical protein